MKLIKAILLSIIFFFTFNVSHIQAEEALAESTIINTVKIQKDYTSDVDLNITLENKNNSKYIDKYTISLPYTEINALKVLENNNNAIYTTTNDEAITTIDINLKDKLFLPSQKSNIRISFNTNQIVKKEDILLIDIPPIHPQEATTSISNNFYIPTSFGAYSYTSVPENTITNADDNYEIHVENNNYDAGLSMQFGKQRIYKFTLNYQLKNDTNEDKTYSITLPPELQTQKVYYAESSISPDRITSDIDGNNVALYILPRNSEKQVQIHGFLDVSIQDPATTDLLNNPELYLQKTEFYDTDSLSTQSIDRDITRSTNTNLENAQLIYDHVLDALEFDHSLYLQNDYSRRLTNDIYKKPYNSLSLEYADYFVSLARGANIPTRTIVGFLYDANRFQIEPNTLHAWVEIYDPDLGWIPFDPALADATNYNFSRHITSNHIALSVWGINDKEPEIIMPINLTINGNVSENIQFKAISTLPSQEGNFMFSVDGSNVNNIQSSFPINLNLTNSSNKIVILEKTEVKGFEFDEFFSDNIYKDAIFPYSTYTKTIHVHPNATLPLVGEEEIEVSIWTNFTDQKEYSDRTMLSFNSMQIYIYSWIITTLLILFSLAMVFFFTKKRNQNKRSKKAPKMINYNPKKKTEILNEVPIHLR